MIGPGSGVRVYLACGATDMRKGILGLAALAQEVLRQQPASGAVFAFRGRRGDRIKLLHCKRCREALGLLVAAQGGIAYGRSHATDSAPI